MDWNQYAKDIRQADANVQRHVSGGKITLSGLGFTNTLHQSVDRQGRDLSISHDAGGLGSEVLAVFFVDKGHYNGPELHWITDNGIIIVTNALRAGGLNICTKLTARPQQLKRYQQGGNRDWIACEQMFPDKDWKAPGWLLDKAQEHQLRGLNYTESTCGDEDDNLEDWQVYKRFAKPKWVVSHSCGKTQEEKHFDSKREADEYLEQMTVGKQ